MHPIKYPPFYEVRNITLPKKKISPVLSNKIQKQLTNYTINQAINQSILLTFLKFAYQ